MRCDYDFTFDTRDGLASGFNEKYKVQKVLYRFQTLNRDSIEYLWFTNCYSKANKKLRALAQ